MSWEREGAVGARLTHARSLVGHEPLRHRVDRVLQTLG